MPFPAANAMGGQQMGVPDVCKTPSPAGPIPIPYPNIAMNAMANIGTCSTKVMVMNSPAMMLTSEWMLSNGYNAGVAGGVVSGVFMGPGKYIMGATKVMVQNKPGAMLTSSAGQNGSSPNIVGTMIAPSQVKVLYT